MTDAFDGGRDERCTRRRAVAAAVTGLGTALAGCSADEGESTTPEGEATVTVRIRNRDGVEREYRVVVRQESNVTNEFSGVLPADQERFVEMVATFRPTEQQHEVTIETEGGQRGRTWDPTDCRDFLVEAFVENGQPGFDAECRSTTANETRPQ